MKDKTFKERLEAGLTRLGYVKQEKFHASTKYTTWKHPEHAPERTLFVGPNGALRVGRCASQSSSLCDAVHYKWCLEKGRMTAGASAYKRILEQGDGQLLVAL